LKCEIVAFDVVEVNPLLDPVGITALAVARIVIEMLSALVEWQAKLRSKK